MSTNIDNLVKDFCLKTPRINRESGVVFAERLKKAFEAQLLSYMQEMEQIRSEVQKYVKAENYWDEQSKEPFQKGALRAREKMFSFVDNILTKNHDRKR